MGFLSGRVTFVRYRVGGGAPLPFGEEHLELVQQHAIGRHGSADPADGVRSGWAGGDHVLDENFDLGKNVVNDALHLAMRVDTDKVPGDLLRAYTKIETDARAKLNPSGSRPRPSGSRPRRPPASGPRPRRPTAASAAASTTRSSGTVRPTPSTPARPAPGCSTG
jgi:hypothetical protein